MRAALLSRRNAFTIDSRPVKGSQGSPGQPYETEGQHTLRRCAVGCVPPQRTAGAAGRLNGATTKLTAASAYTPHLRNSSEPTNPFLKWNRRGPNAVAKRLGHEFIEERRSSPATRGPHSKSSVGLVFADHPVAPQAASSVPSISRLRSRRAAPPARHRPSTAIALLWFEGQPQFHRNTLNGIQKREAPVGPPGSTIPVPFATVPS